MPANHYRPRWATPAAIDLPLAALMGVVQKKIAYGAAVKVIFGAIFTTNANPSAHTGFIA